ncbi:MAG TPA: MepB family protein [Niabella sp.]|nr:MepB family protein [Niabella sp.]
MMDELKRVEKAIFKISGLKISGITEDPECAAYMGCSFQMGRWNVKYRKAKITPKKTGQFVTLWKRNTQNQTEPFSTNDDFDFYLIAAGQEQAFGFFLFPKYILGQKENINNRQ